MTKPTQVRLSDSRFKTRESLRMTLSEAGVGAMVIPSLS